MVYIYVKFDTHVLSGGMLNSTSGWYELLPPVTFSGTTRAVSLLNITFLRVFLYKSN